MSRLRIIALSAAVTLAACAPAEDASDAGAMEGTDEAGTRAVALGPVDGHDLPPSDLDRVQVGDTAPDFTLVSLDGPPVTLSDFRGDENVVLVFYRGHW